MFLFSVTLFASVGNVDFSGEWKLDRENTELSESPLYLSKITITQEKNSLQTSRTYMNQYREQYPFDEEIIVDGEEREIVIYEMRRRTTASWSEDGKSLLITTKTKYCGNSGEGVFSVEETWNLDKKGAILSIDHTGNSEWGTHTGTYFYSKADEKIVSFHNSQLVACFKCLADTFRFLCWRWDSLFRILNCNMAYLLTAYIAFLYAHLLLIQV